MLNETKTESEYKKCGRNRIRESRNKEKTTLEINLEKTSQLTVQIDIKLGEIDYLRTFASKTENIISGAGKTKTKKSKVEECVCRIIAAEKSVQKYMSEIMSLKSQSAKIINKINAAELKGVLINRYIYGKTWEEVSAAIGYSYVHTFRLHKKALEKLRESETGDKKS
jgi:DNA-directed RNA polymerase specialized sigma subunit